jgi:hypothetical protein
MSVAIALKSLPSWPVTRATLFPDEHLDVGVGRASPPGDLEHEEIPLQTEGRTPKRAQKSVGRCAIGGTAWIVGRHERSASMPTEVVIGRALLEEHRPALEGGSLGDPRPHPSRSKSSTAMSAREGDRGSAVRLPQRTPWISFDPRRSANTRSVRVRAVVTGAHRSTGFTTHATSVAATGRSTTDVSR